MGGLSAAGTAALLGPVLISTPEAEAARAPAGKQFYVSPRGSDRNPGTERAPFATIERARDAVRKFKASHPSGDIDVWIRGGTYTLTETVVFGPDDSGNETQTIRYAAYPGETPVFSSGLPIMHWEKVHPGQEPQGVTPQASGNLWAANVPAGRYGTFKTLFDGNQALPRARGAGFQPAANGTLTDLHYPDSALKPWPAQQNVEIVVRPLQLWIVNVLPLASVDESDQIATTGIPASLAMSKVANWAGGFLDDSVWVENVFEVLDTPGEWVLDTTQNKLYLWPKTFTPGHGIVAPQLKELFRVEGVYDETSHDSANVARYLEFSGLTFTHGERDTLTLQDAGLQSDWDLYDKGNALFRLRQTEYITVQDCRFTSGGGSAVRLDLYSQHNRVIDNEISGLGGAGILLAGYGPGTQDVNKYNQVSGNDIHDIGTIYWHSIGIHVWQSGNNTISHNLIHDLPYTGVVVSGVDVSYFEKGGDQRTLVRTIRWEEVGPGPYTSENIQPFIHARNNLIEYNEIHHVMQVMGDGNGVYVRFANWTGNTIRQNYLHDIIGHWSEGAIRMDGGQQGVTVEKNVTYLTTTSGITTKGRNNLLNNVVVDVLETDDPRNVNNAPLYRAYFYAPAGPLDGSVIHRNVLYHSGGDSPLLLATGLITFLPPGSFDHTDMDYNLYYYAQNDEWGEELLASQQSLSLDEHSISADPLFVDKESGNLRLKAGSPAFSIGFQPIDFDHIGPTGR